MTTIKSISSLTLEEPPSCIAFCPTQPDYFVVGTYLLHEAKDGGTSACEGTENDHDASAPAQKRSGSLILYRLSGGKV